MNPIVRCTVAVRDDPLGIGLEPPPALSLRIEPHISVDGPLCVLLAVYNDGDQTVRRSLERSAAVEVKWLEGGLNSTSRKLYRLEWLSPPTGIFACVRQSDATLLRAVCTDAQWEFELQFLSNGFSAFSQACREHGLELTVRSVNYDALDSDGGGGERLQTLLTEKQHEAIVQAQKTGYFEVPRRISTSDLADRFGISDTALSQRLRRGTSTIVRDATAEEFSLDN